MTYNKTTWTAGDTITAEKLNNIENGVEAASAALSYPTITVTRNDPESDRYPSVGMLDGCCISGNALIGAEFGPGTTTAQFIPALAGSVYIVTFSFPNLNARYHVSSNTMEVTLDDMYYIYSESEEYPGDLDLTIDYE